MPTTSFTRGGALTNEINVTPMIDVLLVLLIVFMVSLPHKPAIDVQLPEQRSDAGPPGASSIVLEVDEAGGFRINTRPVAPGGLSAALHGVYDGRPEKVLFVKGSRHARYATVMQAMDVARGAGVAVIGLP